MSPDNSALSTAPAVRPAVRRAVWAQAKTERPAIVTLDSLASLGEQGSEREAGGVTDGNLRTDAATSSPSCDQGSYPEVPRETGHPA